MNDTQNTEEKTIPTEEQQEFFHKLFSMYGCMMTSYDRMARLRMAMAPTREEAERNNEEAYRLAEMLDVEPVVIDELPHPRLIKMAQKAEREVESELERSRELFEGFLNDYPDKHFRIFTEETIEKFLSPDEDDDDVPIVG